MNFSLKLSDYFLIHNYFCVHNVLLKKWVGIYNDRLRCNLYYSPYCHLQLKIKRLVMKKDCLDEQF